MTAALVPIGADLESLADRVYRELRDAIVTKRLAPGSVVTESALAEQLGVSKTPVREALLHLRSSRLVEAHGRRGLRVVEPSIEALVDTIVVRGGLESTAAGLAARNAKAAQKAELLELAGPTLEGDANSPLSIEDELGWRFHLAILEAAHNPYLLGLATEVRAFTEVMERRDLEGVAFPHSRTEAGHQAIADAINRGDAPSAESLMKRHFEDLADFFFAANSKATA